MTVGLCHEIFYGCSQTVNVGSAVIRLRRLEKPSVEVEDEKLLFKIIRGAFNQRRKTLANAVSNFEGLSYSRADVEKALTNLGFDTRVRGEALTLEEFGALSDELGRLGITGQTKKDYI